MQVSWTIIKNFCVARNLSIQYIDLGDSYELRAFDGLFSLECNIPKTDTTDATDFETNYKAKGNISLTQQSPFSAKTFGSKKIYKRIHGISASVSQGSNDIIFTIPYPWVKMTGLDIVGGENLDTISLSVLDTTTGTYSTIPNYILNQFGFTVNVSKDYYSYHSEFDADLYQGMQVKITYTSQSAKTIGINFKLNEVKS